MSASLDKIEKKIRESGDAEIAAMDAETEKAIARIKKEIVEEGEKAFQQACESRKSELELVPRRIMSDARMEKKKHVDSKKTEIVDGVFEKAKERITALGKKDKTAILKSLAENGSRQITDPVVYVDKQYSDLIENAKAEDIGDFGVIVRSKDGSSSVDNTLNNVMKSLQLSLKPAIVKMIFKE
jgi:vacuolar-type H+-ATPase subunit E/Vma4